MTILLSDYLTNNPELISFNTTEDIQSWLDTIPVPSVSNLARVLKMNEIKECLNTTSTNYFFLSLFSALANNENKTIEIKTRNLLTLVIENKIFNVSLLELIIYLFESNLTTQLLSILDLAVYLLLIDEISKQRILVNMSGIKRWEAIGLSTLPTIEEIESIL